MNKQIQIIHLSDLHIGYRNCENKVQAIIKNIIKQEEAANTIIIITGDIVENAFHDKEINAAHKLINQLKEAGFTLLICPGNHDYGNGLINKKEIADKFNQTFIAKPTQFPLVNIIENVLFVGLDSNAEELHWYDRFFADGELGDIQLKKLEEIINDKKHKNNTKIVYLHHHPDSNLPFHKLKDNKKLKKIIENKIDILLFGHNHIGNSYNGRWGIKIMLDGGSSTGKRKIFNPIIHRTINLSDFSIKEKNYLNINR